MKSFFYNFSYKASKVYAGPSYAEKPNLYTILGPKYHSSALLVTPPSEKEYETQMLEMAMGDDAPAKDGLDVGFTVQEGVYSIRPAAHAMTNHHS